MRITNNFASEDFINAKVRGMRSKLLEADRLKALTDSRSLSELFRRIYPASTFEGYLPFERELLADHVHDLALIRRFLSGQIAELFEWLLVEFQLENLKTLLRAHAAGLSPAESESLLIPLPREMDFPHHRLFDTPDPRRFLESIPIREFREIVAGLFHSSEKTTLFETEMTLDKVYAARLMALGRNCAPRVQKLVEQDVAMRNINMIARARVFFQLPFETVRPYLTPTGGYLPKESMERLGQAANLDEIVSALPASVLSPELRGGILSPIGLQDALLLQLYRMAARCFAEAVLDVAVVIAFFYIKRIELANKTRLTQGVRHSLPREELESRLLFRADR